MYRSRAEGKEEKEDIIMKKDRVCAIVLAAGKGSRMGTDTPKQYLEVMGKPILYYSLKAFEDCDAVDTMILVTGAEELDYCRSEIIDRYGFSKIQSVVAGGSERYFSVFEGLKAAEKTGCRWVMIHDGARPFVDNEIIEHNLETARRCKTAVTGMPVKDTIRICEEDGRSISTPDRRMVWQVQTPQTFLCKDILDAYQTMISRGHTDGITDDAMVAERFGQIRTVMTEGSYRNIKITSPEDLQWMRMHLREK